MDWAGVPSEAGVYEASLQVLGGAVGHGDDDRRLRLGRTGAVRLAVCPVKTSVVDVPAASDTVTDAMHAGDETVPLQAPAV